MNNDIKQLMKKKNVYQYQVAEQLGITEWTLLRWLRTKLDKDKKERIIKAINELS